MKLKQGPTHIHSTSGPHQSAQSTQKRNQSTRQVAVNHDRGSVSPKPDKHLSRAGGRSPGSLDPSSSYAQKIAALALPQKQTNSVSMLTDKKITAVSASAKAVVESNQQLVYGAKQPSIAKGLTASGLIEAKVQEHNGSVERERGRRAYKGKTYQTSFSRSDRKQRQSFSDELASPTTVPMFSARRTNPSKNQDLPSIASKGPADQRQDQLDKGLSGTLGKNYAQSSSNFLEQEPLTSTVKKTTVGEHIGRKATPENIKSNNGTDQSLYAQFYKLQQKSASRVSNHRGSRSPGLHRTPTAKVNTVAGQQQAPPSSQKTTIKMDEAHQQMLQRQQFLLMTTPKRTEEPAFKKGTPIPSRSILSGSQMAQQLGVMQSGSRLHSEEGVDGAQAIETAAEEDSDYFVGEADSNSKSPSTKADKRGALTAGEVLQRHLFHQVVAGTSPSRGGPSLGMHVLPQYAHENSSFGLNNSHQIGQQQIQQRVVTQESDEDSEAVVIMPKKKALASASVTRNLEASGDDHRRGRAHRQASQNKNLFAKTSNSGLGNGQTDSNSGFLTTESLMDYNRLARGLVMSQSELTLPSHKERQRRNDQAQDGASSGTDEEVFDEDGGQTVGSNHNANAFQSEDESESLLGLSQNFSPSQLHLQSAMSNIRRSQQPTLTQSQSVQQPLSSYCAWAQQEPHIDEEMSEAEESNSGDQSSDRAIHQYITHVNVEDQTSVPGDEDDQETAMEFDFKADDEIDIDASSKILITEGTAPDQKPLLSSKGQIVGGPDESSSILGSAKRQSHQQRSLKQSGRQYSYSGSLTAANFNKIESSGRPSGGQSGVLSKAKEQRRTKFLNAPNTTNGSRTRNANPSSNNPNHLNEKKRSIKDSSGLVGHSTQQHGYQTPLEMITSTGSALKDSSHTGSKLPPKTATTSVKKRSTQTSTGVANGRSRMKPTTSLLQGGNHLKPSGKTNSIDFSQSVSALSPKRGSQNLLLDANVDGLVSDSSRLNLDGVRTSQVTKRIIGADPLSRGTPRQQPITNFQLQQEQARLMKTKLSHANQKMNKTAFGTSSILSKSQAPAQLAGAGPSEKTLPLTTVPPPQPLTKSQVKEPIAISATTSRPKVKTLVTSSCNLINYQNSITSQLAMSSNKATSKLTKQGLIGAGGHTSVRATDKTSSQFQSHFGASHSAKKASAGVKAGGTCGKGNGANNSSIFVTARQQTGSSSVANCKQIINAAHGASSVRPFSTDVAAAAGGADSNTQRDESSSKSLFSSESPQKRLTSDRQHYQQTPQVSAISFTGLHTGKLPQTAKDSSRGQKSASAAAQGGPLTVMQTSSSSAILHSHLRQLNSHQLSYSNLHLKESALRSGEPSTTKTSTTVTQFIKPKQSTVKTASLMVPVATKSSNPSKESTLTAPLTSVGAISSSQTTAGGFTSHTAARATAKRGGFFKEGTSIPSSHQSQAQMMSAAVSTKALLLATEQSLTFDPSATYTEEESKSSTQIRSTSKCNGKKRQQKTTQNLKNKRSSQTSVVPATTQAASAYVSGQSTKPGVSVKTSADGNYNSNATLFSGSTRQRTNTTMGLVSNKSSSLRQSVNNLALQELVQPTGLMPMTGKSLTKQQTGRGKNTANASGSQSFLGTGQSSKPLNGSTVGGRKNGSTIAPISATPAQASERHEMLTRGGPNGKKSNGPVKASKRGGDGVQSGVPPRSQSALKNHHGPGGVRSSQQFNQSLMTFGDTSTKRHKNSTNTQHSVIMGTAAASEIPTKTQRTGRGYPSGQTRNVQGTATQHDGKRNSVAGGASTAQASSASQQKEWGLADFEKAQYGDRCPKGFEKLQLLGKGGCAVVWLAREQATNRRVALKQFPKPRNASGQVIQGAALDPTAKIEIEMGKLLFSDNTSHNGYSINPKEFPGILKIARLFSVVEETKDVWLVYQVGGKCLTNHLFEVKGEFYKGERLYGVQHQDFYRALKEDKTVLVDFIRMLAQVFDVLAMFRIVHADIKPDNILIDFDGRKLKDIKLIDFGSAFSYENPSNISATTPEYLAPEVLEYLENRGQNTDANGTNSTNLCRRQEPWSYDMWSMGAILLELLTGIPLWLSLKCRAHTQTGKQLFGNGIFGVQGRQGKKILQKQAASLKNLPQTLKKYECYGLDKDPVFMDLLLKMLDTNPITRISPIEILEHPFIKAASNKALASKN